MELFPFYELLSNMSADEYKRKYESSRHATAPPGANAAACLSANPGVHATQNERTAKLESPPNNNLKNTPAPPGEGDGFTAFGNPKH